MPNKRAVMKEGSRYGSLIVLKEIQNLKTRRFICLCDCGKFTVKRGDLLRRGDACSCGCLTKDVHYKTHFKHGFGRTPLYKVWGTMRNRCYSKKRYDYHRYGGRGIVICKEWRDNFLAFREWAIANGYKKGLTIERKDNNDIYKPSNCTWATRRQQANNRRTNRTVTFRGETLTIAQWSRRTGVKQHTLRYRIEAGWAIKVALSAHLKKNVKYSLSGESRTLKEWGHKLSIGYGTLRNRLKSGWSVEKTLTTIVGKQNHDRI